MPTSPYPCAKCRKPITTAKFCADCALKIIPIAVAIGPNLDHMTLDGFMKWADTEADDAGR